MFKPLWPAIILVTLMVAGDILAAAPPVAQPPIDLTKTVFTGSSGDYQLGPTGLRGWMAIKSWKLAPQDMSTYHSTADARQILVTKVEKGSPADGVLAIGDVILGIGAEPFDGDPRRALAAAIDDAEKTEGKGGLKLLRWRPDTPDKEGETARSTGKTEVVTLILKTLGAYSETAPYDCPKTEALLKQTVEALYREGIRGKLNLPLFALLATGETKNIEKARGMVKGIGNPNLKLGVDGHCWNWGYNTILLCEYYFLTGDESVLPAIKEYAVALSKGQSISGTWGHRTASPKLNGGRLHGRLTGYADLSQPSLTCFMGLEMARKCGVEDPELTMALKKCNTFFGYYVDKGGIPYGYHPPMEYMLTDNGTSGTAAIIFSLNGNDAGARFYSKMCGAAHGKIEVGHTGTYFNLLWTELGANVGGPELVAAYSQRWRWLQTLCRKWDGGFVYQAPGGGNRSYRGLSMTAAMALHYSLPRRKLVVTGRDQDKSLWLPREQAQAMVTSWDIDYTKAPDDDLLDLLGHDLPVVRRNAANAISKRDGDVVKKLMPMLNGTRNQRIGACRALMSLKERAAPAADALMGMVRDPKEEQWLRICAANALARIGEPARKHLPELLTMIIADNPDDVRGRLQLNLGDTVRRLAPKPYHQSMDKTLLFPAAMKLLKHPHSIGRWQGMALIHDIPLTEFYRFADMIVHVVLNEDESYTVYKNDHPRKVGLMILERLSIKEGMDLCVKTISDGWGLKWRLMGKEGRLEQLKRFGANAKPWIPKLKELKLGKAGDEAIAVIEQSKVTRKLISLEDAKNAGLKK